MTALPARVSLITPFADGHQVHYAAWVAGGLLERGLRVQLIGPIDWLQGVRAALPEALHPALSVQPLALQPDLASYFALPTPRREGVDLRFLRAAGRAARQHGSDVAHLLYLDRFVLPLLAAWPSYRGLNIQATLHNPTMLPQFRPERRSARQRARVERWGLGQLQRQGLRVQVHSRQIAGQLGIAGRTFFVPHPAVTVTTLGLDGSGAGQLRHDLGLGESDRLLLAFGGTRYDKGADLAARLLPMLPEHVHLLVAGLAEQFGEQQLRELAGPAAHRLHLQLGLVPEAQVNPMFLAADALLLPYRRIYAGQSGPLNIAGALGTPVAAADTGMLAECVRTYALGTVFAAEDLADMAHAVTGALTLPRQPAVAFLRDHSLAAFQTAVLDAYQGDQRRADPPPTLVSGRSG